MSLPAILALLADHGFAPHEHKAHFDAELSNVTYLSRPYQSRHQYASVITYDGAFCELVYETYVAPKDTRRAKGTPRRIDLERVGKTPIASSILRDLNEIRDWCARDVPVWPPAKAAA